MPRWLLLSLLCLLLGAPVAGAAELTGKIVVIDPGHNGGNATHSAFITQQVWAGTLWKDCDTVGAATSSGYTEASHNWDVALRVRAVLEAKGATVILTRRSNSGTGPCITKRAAVGNRAHADAALSIHADGVSSDAATGFHVILPGVAPHQTAAMREQSRQLGVAIRNALRDRGPTAVSNYQGVDGLVTRTDLGGLNLSKVPKVFTEIGNLRAPHDAAILTSTAGRQQEAEALAAGLTAFLLSRRA